MNLLSLLPKHYIVIMLFLFQRILFAGEATHPQMFGSVQGAIMSGIREAQRLTELYPHLMQTDKGKGPSTSQ